jgi:hypothetical protein
MVSGFKVQASGCWSLVSGCWLSVTDHWLIASSQKRVASDLSTEKLNLACRAEALAKAGEHGTSEPSD